MTEQTNKLSIHRERISLDIYASRLTQGQNTHQLSEFFLSKSKLLISSDIKIILAK